MREASILSAFSHLEEELSNSSENGFLCGDFLIYNEREKDKKLESIATYFDTYLNDLGDVEPYSTNRTTPTFFTKHYYSNNYEKTRQDQARKNLLKEGLHFSEILRATESENRSVVIYVSKGAGANKFCQSFKEEIQAREQDDVIKIVELTGNYFLYNQAKNKEAGKKNGV